jgi:addiction module HigA family antidote
MTRKRQIQPAHPGELLREELAERGISLNRLARDIRIPMSRVSLIVSGKRGITADTALRLARYFGSSAEVWMNLQQAYELDVARQEAAGRIERDVIPADAA